MYNQLLRAHNSVCFSLLYYLCCGCQLMHRKSILTRFWSCIYRLCYASSVSLNRFCICYGSFFFITKQKDIIISSLNFKQCSAFEKKYNKNSKRYNWCMEWQIKWKIMLIIIIECHNLSCPSIPYDLKYYVTSLDFGL